jgi:hypothetical protein
MKEVCIPTIIESLTYNSKKMMDLGLSGIQKAGKQ